jgi:hypothetical protein
MPFWTKFWLIVPAVALLVTATVLYRSRKYTSFENDEDAGS